MGIKGTVRRSTDGDFIHANVDIDLIIDEELPPPKVDSSVVGSFEVLTTQPPSKNLFDFE